MLAYHRSIDVDVLRQYTRNLWSREDEDEYEDED